jgi:NitT/TauT family transport system ATP-binding protein
MQNGVTYTDTLLKLSGVNKSLDRLPILRDVNLEIKDLHRPGYTQGQIIGLLGPSGVGKTTLFRLLAGLDEPDSGTILAEKAGIPVHRGMVGVVAQDYHLFAHRTVLGNLTVAGRQAGLSGTQAREQATSLLERFGIAEHARKYPAQLSGGQRQRVAIAQQLLCSDHFLLMDEPFSGLDMLAAQRVSQFIQEMAQSDELKTFILVTHDIGAALQVADTILLLGRDRDAQGKAIPGARIQASYNLIERDVCWRDGVTTTPEFLQLLQEIREIFPTL